MTTTQSEPALSGTRRRTTVIGVGVGVAVALAAASLDAYVALAAGVSTSFAPLRPAIFAPFVAAGVIAAYIGWSMIARRAARPAAVLRVLVPVLLVVSFIPDLLLLVTGFIPGSSPSAVIALALMHVIVVAVVVPLGMRLAPLPSVTPARDAADSAWSPRRPDRTTPSQAPRR